MSNPEANGPGDSPITTGQLPQQTHHPNLYQQMPPSNNTPSGSSLFINPQAAAQAATAALAAAAQQVAHAQMQVNGNSNTAQKATPFSVNNMPNQAMNTEHSTPNPQVQSVTPMNNNHPSATDVTKQASNGVVQPQPQVPQQPAITNIAVPQTISNPQQIAISAQAQAQAAAILAAGSALNPGLFFNTSSTPAPAALAAAQVVASLMQQQQQQQQQQPNASHMSEQKPPPQQVQAPPVHHINHSGQTSGQPNGAFIPQNHTPPPNPADPNTITAPFKPNHSFVVGNQQGNIPATKKQPSPLLSTSSVVATKPQPPPAVSNGLYAAAAAAASNPILLAQMQNWKLDQLEAHVKLLRDNNQPIPQPVSLLLSEAIRREEKRTAKRVANRKSACTSRARKKALVEEMTRTNAKLKRQALILSLLPDLVIAIKTDGTITFCSAQVERVLRHKVDDMVGANISEILVPSCRDSLVKLVEKLLAAEQAALLDDANKQQVDESGVSSNSGGAASGAAIVSEQSEQGFPLSVVKVKSRNGAKNEGNKTISRDSDFGTPSTPSPTNDDLSYAAKAAGKATTPSALKYQSCNGDDSASSNDAKQLIKANEALSNNVRRHNAQLLSKKSNENENKSHKDDVTGASVTPNNAGARLSSLKHTSEENLEDNSLSTSTDSLLAGVEDKGSKPQRPPNADVSEDSGYRESGESDPCQEDTASSTSGTSNAGSRPRPLAPTCNVSLIRDDLTTILCEVTSSIRTRSLSDETSGESSQSPAASGSKEKAETSKEKKEQVKASNDESPSGSSDGYMKELLLCLRPIRDGEETVGDEFRFIPNKQSLTPPMKSQEEGKLSKPKQEENAKTLHPVAPISNTASTVKTSKSRPMKKRPLSSPPGASLALESPSQKMRTSGQNGSSNDAEKSVVESLMLMSSNRK